MKKYKNIIFIPIMISLCCLFLPYLLRADGSAGNKYSFESRYCIDMPNAGVIPKGNFAFNGTVMTGGSFMLDFDACFVESLLLGLSYSANGLIGNSDLITSQAIPGVNLRYRFLDEKRSIPAMALGFSNQGRGTYIKSLKRFEVLSPGAYLAFSKNFRWELGELSTHLTVNYSFESDSEERSPNVALGLEQMLGSRLALCLEYNANADEGNKVYNDKGLINNSLKFSAGYGLTIEFQLKDLLQNHKEQSTINRYLKIEYISRF